MPAIDDYSSRVLDVVDSIPPGQVMSYGDIAEYLGAGGPRQVGRVLSRYGGGAPWWRVTRGDGTPPPGHEAVALTHYLAEGTPLLSPGGATPRCQDAASLIAKTAVISGSQRPDQGSGVTAEAGTDGQRDGARVRVDMRQARWRGVG